MYTLIREIDEPHYAIVQLSTYSWGPCISGSNWFNTIPDALNATFKSPLPFCVENQTDDDIYFQQFTSVEDYCAALCAHPSYISPEVVCHFESPDNFFDQFPELLI